MRKVLVLATACLLMTSCVIDKREMVSAEEAYNKEFANVFGETDPNHTWMMVENQSVEVNLDKPSQVKIYVKAGDKYKLAGNYENVSGKQTLTFDAPMGCDDVYVTVDGAPMMGAGSRVQEEPGIDATVTATGAYKEFKLAEINQFKADNETLPERVDNRDKVTMDYRIKPETGGGTYYFYPLFWNAMYYHTIGLYYYYNTGWSTVLKTVEICQTKEGDCLQFKNSNGDWEDVESRYAYEGIYKQNYEDTDVVLRSKGYIIHFPVLPEEFGFYVNVTHKNEDGSFTEIGTYYSNPELNEAGNSYSAFAYLEHGEDTYITLEDHKSDDFDYNDFIFMMEGKQVEHIEEDPVEYIYAVEDLGGSDDFDFNDVVFSVSHVSGQPHATVQLLAAGGTLPATMYFNETALGEVHAKFDVETNVMVNTAEGTTKSNMKYSKPFSVNVGTDWSHTAYTTEGNGFNVKVTKDDGVTVVTTPVPGEDDAPQILVLSENWLWPTERTRINTAYPQFGEWGENYTNTTWVDEYVRSKVVDWVEAPQTNQ